MFAYDGGGINDDLYVEDVFSAFTYTGTGAAQSIVNGVDLATKGGLVWTKNRDQPDWHFLFDTARGVTNRLSSNSTNGNSADAQTITAFNSNGYSIGTDPSMNTSTEKFVSWTFRKAPNFFDVVTYTGNGANRTISHNLGTVPGMIIVKETSGTGTWWVYHRSIGATQTLFLELTSAATTVSTAWNNTAPTSTDFSIGTHGDINGSGNTYVAYLFAHDTTSDGIIQCGSVTTDSTSPGLAVVNLGWEPQYVLFKGANSATSWEILDTSRGFDLSATDRRLIANSSAVEDSNDLGNPLTNGFVRRTFDPNRVYVYIAIRKGLMRTPTDATKVFDINARTGTGATATVTAGSITQGVDLAVTKIRSGGISAMWMDRLRGSNTQLVSATTSAETTYTTEVTNFNMSSVTFGTSASSSATNSSGQTYVNYFLKQARGFFDIVNYTGTGAAHTETHNLGVVPELMIIKNRSSISNWTVYIGDDTDYLRLELTNAVAGGAGYWNSTVATEAVFSLGNESTINASGNNFIAYLFATCPGVSKIGTYPGTGAAQDIPCGFTAGARFVLIKRIDSTGDWYYWDSTRGIISGNDPYLLMNSTAAEVTSTDYIEPYSTGFALDATAPAALNASGGTYLFLAIA